MFKVGSPTSGFVKTVEEKYRKKKLNLNFFRSK